MFRLTEYLYYNSAQIYAAIQKFAIYPVTEITYVSSTNEKLKDRYKRLHNKILKTKKILTLGALDKYVYGNAFFSLYTPFIRFLRCTHCKRLSNIEQTNYTFTLKKLEFRFECLSCKRASLGEVVDRKLVRPERLNVIRWDPKLMDIDYNPITGQSKYYFTIPKQLKEQVIKGNKHLLNTLPMEFIRAIKADRVFKFADGKIFHMKMGAPAGIEAQWGFPPLASTVKLFFYASVLRKANECVSPETWIETPTGYTQAKDIKLGDLVRTHLGRFKPIEKIVPRTARENEKGIKVTVAGLPHLPAVFSPKHPVLSFAKKDPDLYPQQPPGRVLKHHALYEEVYTPAELLAKNNYVLYPARLPEESQTVDVAQYSGLRRVGDFVYSNETLTETLEQFAKLEAGEPTVPGTNAKVAKRIFKAGKVPRRMRAQLPLDKDLAYILGVYAGDGSCNANSVMFSLGLGDDYLTLVNSIKRVFGITARIALTKSVRTVTICSVLVRNLIKGLIPGRARNKAIPEVVLHAPKDIKASFLHGYYLADGYDSGVKLVYATSSERLAFDVYRLGLSLGCIVSTRKMETGISRLRDGREIVGGSHFHVTLSGDSRQRLWDLISNTLNPTKVTSGKSGFFFNEDFFAARIKSVEEVESSTYVDFHVTDDKTFCTPGVATKNSIALDYVVPMRIISPRASSANADPVTTISLSKWTDEMKTSVKKWRKDPLHIMWSPIPAEITHLGGQARALMTLGEVQEAEANIIAAMGIPKEFIYGGLSYAGSAITLRMLENQLIAHTADLNDLLQWITDEVAKALGWGSVEVELSKFKLVDDVEQKRLILALNENPQKPLISDESIADQFGFDLQEERKKRFQNMLDEARAQQEFQQEVQQLQNTMAQKIQAQMAIGGSAGIQYDQQAVIAQAEQIVQQLMTMDPGMRKSQLHSLQSEDYVMYSVVIQRLEETQKTMQNEAKAQMTGQPPMA
jgi:hypothetical protein